MKPTVMKVSRPPPTPHPRLDGCEAHGHEGRARDDGARVLVALEVQHDALAREGREAADGADVA